MEHYDVFISYRRNGGDMIAARVHESLLARGYSAFLDVEDLTACEFDLRLMELIRACKDFVLVLTPGSLDRCADERDWVRREIECALKSGVNIVLVLQQDFVFPKELPESIARVAMHNGVVAYASLWSAVMDKLETFLHAEPDGAKAGRAARQAGKAARQAGKAARREGKAARREGKSRAAGAVLAVLLALVLLGAAALFALTGVRSHLGTKLMGADWAYMAGFDAMNAGNEDAALAYFVAAANEGHAKAARELGERAYFAAEPDYRSAAQWFAKAEAAGETVVRYYLGWCAEQLHEDAEAARWYALAAQDGVTEAMVQLSIMYFDGRGVAEDPQEAIRLLEKAAERGNYVAMANLGAIYDQGKVTQKDEEKALTYYARAVDAGYRNEEIELRLQARKDRATHRQEMQAEEVKPDSVKSKLLSLEKELLMLEQEIAIDELQDAD